MSTNYKLLVNNNASFEVTENDLQKLDAVKVEATKFHVLKENKPYNAEVVSADFISKKYTVKVNNNTYEVTISDPLDELIKSMGIQRGRTKLVNAIKAPMPGMVISVMVSEGQSVQKGDSVLILEAMKMENVIKAPGDGVIKSIKIKQGTAVEKNQVLIELA